MTRMLGFGLLLALSGHAAPAWAQGTPLGTGEVAFGQQGSWVLSGDFQLQVRAGGDDRILINPSLDYFLMSRLSVGGHVRLLFTSGDYSEQGVGGRVGYSFPLTDRVSWWPRAGLIYTRGDGNNVDFDVVDLDISAPFLFHLVPNFFFGLGPVATIKVYGDGDAVFGLQSVVGGTFSL